MNDWEYEKTISPPSKIKVQYTVENNGVIEKKEVVLSSTVWSETTTEYVTVNYIDTEGKEAAQDVAVRRTSSTRNTVAAANGALVKWRLTNKRGLPSGDATKTSESTYKYWITSEGPKLHIERTEEVITDFELAGSLSITDYTGWEPIGSELTASVTRTEYEEKTTDTGRPYTKTVTTRWMALGLTQEGQQSAAEQLKEEDGSGNVLQKVVFAMQELICDGSEVRTTTGRIPNQGRPSAQDMAADEVEEDPMPEQDETGGNGYFTNYNDGGGGGGGGGGPSTAELEFSDSDTPAPTTDWTDYDQDSNGDGIPDWAEYVPDPANWQDYEGDNNLDGFPDWAEYVPTIDDPASDYTTIEYPMPYAPDDHFELGPDGEKVLVPGGAQEAAREYGNMLNALKAGHAYGMNITTSADRLPSRPFAPLYINAAGLSVACRVNGTSWAFDGSGLVVSSDLMLCGVAGKLAES